MEAKRLDGDETWRLCCLEHALRVARGRSRGRFKCLDDFDKAPSAKEAADMSAKFGKPPSVQDLRTRFDNLGRRNRLAEMRTSYSARCRLLHHAGNRDDTQQVLTKFEAWCKVMWQQRSG